MASRSSSAPNPRTGCQPLWAASGLYKRMGRPLCRMRPLALPRPHSLPAHSGSTGTSTESTPLPSACAPLLHPPTSQGRACIRATQQGPAASGQPGKKSPVLTRGNPRQGHFRAAALSQLCNLALCFSEPLKQRSRVPWTSRRTLWVTGHLPHPWPGPSGL